MTNIGIVYTNTFSRVLKRFYDEQKDFQRDMDLNVRIPVKSNATNDSSPLSGATFSGALGSLRIDSYEDLLSALPNKKHDQSAKKSRYSDLCQYDDLMFVAPFQPDINEYEIKLPEAVCRFAFGGAVLSNFAAAVREHKQIRLPGNRDFTIAATELVLCSAEMFQDTRELFIANALHSAEDLLKHVPPSTFTTLRTSTADNNSFFWKKGFCKQKMFMCLSVQPIGKQHSWISTGQQSFALNLSGLEESSAANHNLGLVLLETLFVSQKPIKSEFS